jgi:hypothetical protein
MPLSAEEKAQVRELVQVSLDEAAGIWRQYGEELVEAHAMDSANRALIKKAETVTSRRRSANLSPSSPTCVTQANIYSVESARETPT